jgi:mannose-6-phosphate isomerase-like protein (cupin superfamily)
MTEESTTLKAMLLRTFRSSQPTPVRRRLFSNVKDDGKNWNFVHHVAADAKWTPGLRDIFEYRDLGIAEGTKGDYVAHVIRHNGRKVKDEVHQWHSHTCKFQMVYILEGWVKFEYEGQGVKTLKKGDNILQVPGIKHREIECSEDLEMLEIVSPADFKTTLH